MAKIGSKIRCILKRWNSSSKITRFGGGDSSSGSSQGTDRWHVASFHGADKVPAAALHPVYVGKSRRRYLVSSELVDHPLFQVLLERSGGSDGAGATTVVGCEVVLFEHLLWMLKNADPQPDSLEELIDFYACC